MLVVLGVVVLAGGAAVVGLGASSDSGGSFAAGDLLVSRSVYDNDPANVQAGVTQLPPGCTTGCATAIAGGAYPQVFNNDLVDGSFGITSKVFLDEVTPAGSLVRSVEVPNSADPAAAAGGDQLVTSFSSKSELALNLSTDGESISFMGYQAPVDSLDVSNSNTPAVVDPTNPVPGTDYRVVGQLDSHGTFRFTDTNAYSGNNGRAAILNAGANVDYTAGNAGNGGNPQPNGVILGAGAQILDPSTKPQSGQTPGTPAPVGSFNITQLGDKADKVGKDTNFRGLTIFDNVVYFTKGSGGNGVNTVYFIDTTGQACPKGVGLPAANAALPATPIAYNPANLQSLGVAPYNMCVLKGFTTTLAKNTTTSFPFGLWFANATTLYVADEGDGTNTYSAATNTYSAAAASKTAGLQKWVFNGTQWNLAYTLQAGLGLGVPYTVAGYPGGNNPATGLPWMPATDGLRNLTGHVDADGTATIYGITSTVSGSGDQGADPNRLVSITDSLASTTGAGESFGTVRAAGFGEVLRGVSFAPVCGAPVCDQAGANLQNGDLAGAALQGVDLSGANVQHANLTGANLRDTLLGGANLQGSTLDGANLVGAELGGANLQHGSYANANLTGADLSDANLQGSDLTGANLTGASLAGAHLQKVTWSGTTCPDGTRSDADGGTCAANLGG
jgi:hypothetical protein